MTVAPHCLSPATLFMLAAQVCAIGANKQEPTYVRFQQDSSSVYISRIFVNKRTLRAECSCNKHYCVTSKGITLLKGKDDLSGQMYMIAPLDLHFSILYDVLKKHVADDADYKVSYLSR